MTSTRRRFDRSRLVVSFVVVLGAAFILIGVAGSVTGRDQSNLPDEIERIEPSLGDKVLNQANVLVDLAAGYGGRLEVDSQPIETVTLQEPEPTGGAPASVAGDGAATPVPFPVADVDPNAARFDPGSNTLSYQPRPGADLERFSVGRHSVKVFYWRLTEGEANSLSYGWYFDVTA